MFSIVQIHKPEERNNIVIYDDIPMVICETIKSNESKLVVEEEKDNVIFAKIYYKEFRFDECRNIAKSLAKTEYIFSLDADEGIYNTKEEIEKHLKSNYDAYTVHVASLSPTSEYSIKECTRIFKKELSWWGYAHERPIKSFENDKVEDVKELCRTDILIKHIGYTDNNINKQKATRNVDLILKSGYAIFDKYQRIKLNSNLDYELNGEKK